MIDQIFDKTRKGREEIATGKHQLRPNLRSVLVVIDGIRSERELVDNFDWLGLNHGAILALLDAGFIRNVEPGIDRGFTRRQLAVSQMASTR